VPGCFFEGFARMFIWLAVGWAQKKSTLGPRPSKRTLWGRNRWIWPLRSEMDGPDLTSVTAILRLPLPRSRRKNISEKKGVCKKPGNPRGGGGGGDAGGGDADGGAVGAGGRPPAAQALRQRLHGFQGPSPSLPLRSSPPLASPPRNRTRLGRPSEIQRG
jgi:hypothetical protein